MVDKEMILDRISLIKKSVKRLKKLGKTPEKEFKNNEDFFAIGEHHLRRALEAVLDIGRHICVKEDLGQPQDYTEIFDILAKNGILEKEFSKKIRGMAGYRNRLVHMYNQITVQELYDILQERLDDFEVFTKEVLKYIRKEEEKEESKNE